jgi:hypothetical protein
MASGLPVEQADNSYLNDLAPHLQRVPNLTLHLENCDFRRNILSQWAVFFITNTVVFIVHTAKKNSEKC